MGCGTELQQVSLGVIMVDVELQWIMMKIETQFMKNISDPFIRKGQTPSLVNDYKDEYGDTFEDFIDEWPLSKDNGKTIED
jgi:hypothetical protein